MREDQDVINEPVMHDEALRLDSVHDLVIDLPSYRSPAPLQLQQQRLPAPIRVPWKARNPIELPCV